MKKNYIMITVLVLLFIGSYIAFDHVDNSYVMSDNKLSERLEAENDSLRVVLRDDYYKQKYLEILAENDSLITLIDGQ